MFFIAVLISLALGWLALWSFEGERSYSLLTRIGGSWLLGVGLQTLGMSLLDFMGAGVTLSNVWLFSGLLGLGFVALQYRRAQPFSIQLFPYESRLDFKRINLFWLLLFGISAWILYGIWLKGLFFPTFAFDSVAGYDLMAKVVAAEGTWANSLFDETGRAINGSAHRLIYPPLTSGSMAYAYLAGLETPKIIMLLHYTAFLLLIYGLLRRHTSHTGSMLITLLIIFIPEMTAHAALSLSNLPQAIYVVGGMLALYTWVRLKDEKYFVLALALIALNTWTRSEGVLFVLIPVPLLLWPLHQQSLKQRILRAGLFIGIGFAPFLLWQLFLSSMGIGPDVDNPQLLRFAWDADKLDQLLKTTVFGFETRPALFFTGVYYGLNMQLFLLFLPLSVYSFIKQPKARVPMLALLYICLASILSFLVFYYFIDYSWDDMSNVLSYSFKRGLFCIMPLLVLYCGLHPLSRRAFRAMDRWWYGSAKQ